MDPIKRRKLLIKFPKEKEKEKDMMAYILNGYNVSL